MPEVPQRQLRVQARAAAESLRGLGLLLAFLGLGGAFVLAALAPGSLRRWPPHVVTAFACAGSMAMTTVGVLMVVTSVQLARGSLAAARTSMSLSRWSGLTAVACATGLVGWSVLNAGRQNGLALAMGGIAIACIATAAVAYAREMQRSAAAIRQLEGGPSHGFAVVMPTAKPTDDPKSPTAP